ncbi:MAG: hypothetical protein KAJ69_03890 [Thermoplasmatales archaeon]|nr:hypothetical protein [Thermoplasmatales archaeon]
MVEKTNLSKIEKKIYSSMFNDGTLDILGGLWLLGLGLSIFLADLGFGISEELMLYTVIPAFVVYFALIFFVTNPRKGVMKLPEKVQRSKTKFLTIQMIWLVVAFIAGIYFSLQPVNSGVWNDISVSLFWIIGSIILFSIAAFTLKIDRFYVYGLLVSIPFPFRIFTKKIFFGISTSMFFVVAIIILVWGIIILIRFIKNTPKTDKL